MTRHDKTEHINKGKFDHPFPCPKCCREGLPSPPVIFGAMEWSSHVEQAHDRERLRRCWAGAPRMSLCASSMEIPSCPPLAE